MWVIFRTFSLALAFVLVFALSSPVYAQRGGGGSGGGGGGGDSTDLSAAIEWDKRAEVEERLMAHGLELLGDNIDPHTGTISFRQTDVSLPGNSALPVAVTRELTQGYFHSFSVDVEFGDWNLSVPRLHVVTAVTSSQSVNHWAGARCTNPQSVFAPKMYYGTTGVNPTNWAFPVEYSNGLLMDVPGYGSQQVLKKSTTTTVPFPSSAKYVTAENWYLTCGSASDGGEGFIAIAPNGDRYRFDRYVQHTHRNLGAVALDGGNAGSSRYISRVRAMLMATEVTDVYGNWVRYTYDSSGRLTRIHANDGRSITLTYSGSSKVVWKVTANGRVWTYSYVAQSVSDPFVGDYGNDKKILSSVKRPDGRSWSLNLLNMHKRAHTGTRCVNYGGSMSLTHPNGVTGTYAIAETLHRRGYAEWMTETTIRCYGGFVDPRQPTYYDIYHAPLETMSVTQKSITGPNMPTSQWIYTYESDVDEQRYPTGHQYAGHPIATSGSDPTNWTKVRNPDGSETTYYHFWNMSTGLNAPSGTFFGGKLDRSETRASVGGTVLETIENHYVQTGIFGATYIPNNYSGAPLSQIIVPLSTGTPIKSAKTVTKRDGDTFTSEYVYNTSQNSASYSYGHPIQSKVYSNVSTSPRTTDFVYEHNKTKWVLGLPKTVTVNGRQTDQYNYYTTGALSEHWKYGVRVRKYSRYSSGSAAGQISSVLDALNRKTELISWKRGTPQRIKRPDARSIYQYVDNNGWMTSSKDARGYSTSYSRDAMGRLTLVNPPGSWANTTISYNFSGGGAVQTITKGQSRTTITYDGLFRPVLERTQALDTGWSSYVNTDYDAMGRVAFESQPSTSATTGAGMDFTYDALGRIKTETETVSPYAKTRHYYYSSHRHRVLDPSNAYMDHYSYGYDGPGNTNYRALYHSSGQKTYIYKNIWDETTSVRQWGTQNGYTVDRRHYYYYDSKRRLCRHYVPEGGATKYQYDAAGQMTAYAKGQSNSGCGTVPSSSARVTQSYDVLGRPTLTNFQHSGTPDISRTYDADGNLKAVNRGGVNWSYSYNDINLLTNEYLDVDGRNYDLAYYYNSSGYLNRKILPTGRNIYISLDGLGRARTIVNNSTILASSIGYHASGAVSALNYGNGQLFTQTLNARLLPQRLRSYKGSQTAIDQTYSYDIRGNLTGIIDAAVSGNNRSHSFDALSRIRTASGPWGFGSYTYDALGNMRKKTLGSRTVNLSYNSLNRLSQSADTGPSGTRTVTHDARGNVTTLGGLTFGYDYSDQPVSLSGSASGTYRYDGNLRRVKSVVNGKTIYNVYDAAGSLVHIDEVTAGRKTDYVRGPAGSLARIRNHVVTFLHPDYLGSAQSGTNGSGNVIWREQYTPYGEELQSPPGNDDQAGYTGHIKDSATGLNYMQARYYDPVIGRFLSIDPVGFATSDPMSFNRYLYVNNNPYKYVDPDGEVLKLAKAAFNVVRRTVKNGGNLKKGLKDELVSIADNASTLLDGQLTVDDAFAAIDLLTGFGGEARRLTGKTCCFVAGTLVDTEDGLKPIEDVEIGELVWARNVETGETALKAVTDLIRRHEREIWIVELSGPEGETEQFETTDDHPWWIDGTGWVETRDLALGQRATSRYNKSAVVTEVTRTERLDATYNLTVADYATYFAGSSRVLVHNCGDGVPRRTEGAGRPALRDDPYSPANVNRRQSETRDNLGLNRDPDTPIPDQRPGRDMGGHEARGRKPHDTGERNVNRHEEHSRRPKGYR